MGHSSTRHANAIPTDTLAATDFVVFANSKTAQRQKITHVEWAGALGETKITLQVRKLDTYLCI
jgi:hypothetical protein